MKMGSPKMTGTMAIVKTVMKIWLVTISLGFAISVALTASPPASGAAQGAGTVPDVDKLFSRIYPVFVHDRCANCHGTIKAYPGLIRSVTNDTHPGGVIDAFDPKDGFALECGMCHDASKEIEKEWQFSAPDSMAWAGKNEEQVCAIEATQVLLMNGRAGGIPRRAARAATCITSRQTCSSTRRGRAGPAEPAVPKNILRRTICPFRRLGKRAFLDAAAA